MKLTGLGCALIFMLYAFSAAEGASWVSLISDSEGNQWYVDSESITHSSVDTVKAWEKTVYSEKEKAKEISQHDPTYSDLKESTFLSEYNCITKERRILAFADYDSQGGEIYADKISTTEWRPISPESVSEALYQFVCEKKGR